MDTEQLKITAGKLKGDLFCHYAFRQQIGEDMQDSGKIQSERPIHDDLRNQFNALTFHMPVLFQYLKPEDILDPEKEEKTIRDEARDIIKLFRVTEFILDLDENMVSLVGTMALDLGAAQITTPFVSLEGPYHYALELRTTIEDLCQEIKEYIAGKQAPRFVQTDLFNDDENGSSKIVDDIEQPVKEKKKRGRPKKEKPADESKPDDAESPFGTGEVRTGDEDPFAGHMPLTGYDPLPDEEFNQPITNFHRDPLELEKENGF